ncbi:MAG: hypothetical protein KJ058_13110 [Thermoanaerobaculia bacterium]|nr:hypothetical protein [Thermoanaerobaculia bacterium]
MPKAPPPSAPGRVLALQDNVYRRRIYAFMGTRAELKDHLRVTWPGEKVRKKLCPDALGQMFHFKHAFVDGVKTRVYYIWSVKFDDSVEDTGTLAHEAFHVAAQILNDLGVDTSDADGSESLAYYFESIFRQTLSFAREHHTGRG